jgi:hypothetical protein
MQPTSDNIHSIHHCTFNWSRVFAGTLVGIVVKMLRYTGAPRTIQTNGMYLVIDVEYEKET